MIELTYGPGDQVWADLPLMVQSGTHYKNAPITQAIIEIRCELPSDTLLEDLRVCGDDEGFPTSENLQQAQVELGADDSANKITGRQLGYILRHKNGRTVIASRLNGFSYTALAPYMGWEDFIAHVWSFWEKYRQATSPLSISRLGVRFVNQIDVPKSQIEIKDYVRTAVDISPYLPQSVSGYFLQVTMPLEKLDSAVTVTSTIIPPSNPDLTSLILDIDAFYQADIDLNTSTSTDEIRARLNGLRDAKNYVFEACITDATRGLIS